MTRCVNIDWLECYCLEDAIGFPHDARFFEQRGWEVRQREYGTPMYHEMFTLYDHFGEPFIEVRRSPKSDQRKLNGLFNPYSCHLRLVNRACYAQTAARNMAQFIAQNGFQFQRLTRIDLCLDFERFDTGDDPAKFIARYMSGKYSKINQSNIAAHGLDQWDGRLWNSLSWGSPKSMIKTRFYNKTMELSDAKKDKPYIRQAWQSAGLVDDWITLEKHNADGQLYKPVIWRLEFAIKSGTKNWFVVEDYNGDRKQLRSFHNNLSVYDTRQQIFNVIMSLAHHYFHFKHLEYVREGELQRKDRCRDKELFKPSEQDTFYKLEKVMSEKAHDRHLDALLTKLYVYRDLQYEEKVREACNIIIERLESQRSVTELSRPMDEQEIELLRRVIALRLSERNVTVTQAMDETMAMMKIERELWNSTF